MSVELIPTAVRGDEEGREKEGSEGSIWALMPESGGTNTEPPTKLDSETMSTEYV